MTARIHPTTPTNTPEATQPLLAQLKASLGMVPALYATIGHSPGTLQAYLAWGAALEKGSLSRREIELLNIHVSELNGCGYCLSAHVLVGAQVGLSASDIEAARSGTGANAREEALLALARRVVRTGGAGAGAELARAREAAVTDAQIVDALAVVAIRSFTNAMAIVAQTPIDFPKVARLPGA
jgi:uncharacterized peroxidase-related enzyme